MHVLRNCIAGKQVWKNVLMQPESSFFTDDLITWIHSKILAMSSTQQRENVSFYCDFGLHLDHMETNIFFNIIQRTSTIYDRPISIKQLKKHILIFL